MKENMFETINIFSQTQQASWLIYADYNIEQHDVL